MSLELESCEPQTMDLAAKNSSNSNVNPTSGPKNPKAKNPDHYSPHDSQCAEPEHVEKSSKTNTTSNSRKPCESNKKDQVMKNGASSASHSLPLPSPKMSTNHEQLSAASTVPQNTKLPTDAKTSNTQGRTARSNSLDGTPFRPHTGGDVRWEAINSLSSKDSPLDLSHFRLLKRLGYGDIGSVYLVELRGTNAFFAMKVMDKGSLASRNKLIRAQTEREILGLLDHPFLPTLYSYFETDKFYCLVMEFCSGGNLHIVRQKQPNKYFTEEAARFYVSEVLLALEYLHMLGIVYRDLKPENVLVREEGHIMLSDFDLSLRCTVNPTLVKSLAHMGSGNASAAGILENENVVQGVQPSSFFPRILPSKKNRKSKSELGLFVGGSLPELMAEPTNVRSMSFVGTHEYLAPEIIRGEGHGSAVDWWTLGIFLYELLHGITPFKGNGNRATLFNVVGQPLKFPDSPQVSGVARDLIKGLLVKDPQKRIAYKRGATEIKQHPFFEGMNWALVRSATPPIVPEPVDFSQYASKDAEQQPASKKTEIGGNDKSNNSSSPPDDSTYVEFEYF